MDGEVGPVAGLGHGGAELVVADADRDLLGAVAAAELGEALDDGLGLVGGAVGDDELAVGDVDGAAGPEGALEAAVGVEAVGEALGGVDEGGGSLAVGADDGSLHAGEVDDADEDELVAGVDGGVGVDEGRDGLAAALVRVDAVAAAEAFAVAVGEALEGGPAQGLAVHVHAVGDVGDVPQAEELAGELFDDVADLGGELVPGGPVQGVGAGREEGGDLGRVGLAEGVHPAEAALEVGGGAGGGRDQLVDHGAGGQDLRGDQAQAGLGALGEEGVEQQTAGAGARQDAANLPQVAALAVAMLADEPGGRRGQQRPLPVQPLPVHDQDPG